MEHPRKRVDGARALALAFVLQSESLTRIKNLTRPGYGRLRLVDSNNIVAKVHALVVDTFAQIAEERDARDMPRDRYAPLPKDLWTVQGDNGHDEPMNVGVFGNQADAHKWADRQNETQSDQDWGRGSAGPMRFTPKPIYAGSGLDPKVLVLPERQWEAK